MWRPPTTYEETTLDRLREFDPNTLPSYRFATFIPSRNPEFKIHRDRAPALSAIGGHNNAILYERDEAGRWTEIFRAELVNLKDRCDDCNHKVVPNANGRVGFFDRLYMVWERHKGKIVDPPRARYVCAPCKRHYR